ncbi:MAG: lipocalin-like domain-containing protein [Clostridiaceae bacterium]
MKQPIPSSIRLRKEDFQSLGLNPVRVELWEDGMRTDGGRGSYEWWYFDSHLDDGGKLVIVFLTKSFVTPNRPLTPTITLQYDAPDGTHYEEMLTFPATQFSASRERCDVRMGDNVFSGDLNRYTIRLAGKQICAELTLTGRVPAWRPGTGQIFFGKHDEHFFAWLPSVPEGNVEGELTINGQKQRIVGTGYHDHNWGNVSMLSLMNHWYWGRAKIGEYTVISSFITAEKKYGYRTFPVFLLAKNGVMVAQSSLDSPVFAQRGEHLDGFTKKPVHDELVYDHTNGNERYVVTYRREKDLLRTRFADTLPLPTRLLAKLIGFSGAYLRFTGTAGLEHYENGALTERVSDPAIWELMYFGHTQKSQQ